MVGPTGRWYTAWTALALVVAAMLAFVLYSFLGTFVLGLFLYYVSRPVYVRLRRRVQRPNLAAAAALFLLVLPVLLLFWYVAAVAVERLGSLGQVDLSGIEALLAPYFEFAGPAGDLGALLDSIVSDPSLLLQDGRLREVATTVITTLGQFLGVFLNGVVQLFIALALAFYLLRDDHRIAAWVQANFEDDLLVTYGRAVDADLQTVFFGNILNAVLTGIIGAVVFLGLAAVAPAAVPLPVPVLLGLLTGVGSLVPVVGMKIVYFPVALYLLALALAADPRLVWFPALFFVVTTVVVDMIPDLVLRPYVSGRNLHIGLVMFAYIFGPLLFGWYGIFLGPLLVVAGSHLASIVVPALTGSARQRTFRTSLSDWTGEGDPGGTEIEPDE
jgi:predicted PurR-regulated permease PerM